MKSIKVKSINRIISRTLFIFTLFSLWIIFIYLYEFLPHTNLSYLMTGIWIQSKEAYLFVYRTFIFENKILYFFFKLFYTYVFGLSIIIAYLYFLYKYHLIDKILFSTLIGIIFSLIIYATIKIEPPWKVYEIYVPSFNRIFNFFIREGFSFPSFHIFFSSLFWLFFMKYSNSILLKTYFTFVALLYPIIVFFLAMHWIIDIIYSFILSYFSFKISENNRYVEIFRNKILKKYEELLDYFYTIYTSLLNKISPLKKSLLSFNF